MKTNLEELRQTAARWNEERQASTKARNLFIGGILSIVFGVFFVMMMVDEKAPEFMPILFAIIPIAGFIQLIMGFAASGKAKSYKKKLEELGPERLKRLEYAMNDVTLSEQKKHSSVFTFYHFEGSGKSRRQINWAASVKDDYIVVLRKPRDEIYFPSLDGLKILKGKKALFSNDFSAKTTIGGKDYDIQISPESYDKYVMCLEKAFDKDNGSTETKDDESDEIVKFDLEN